MSESRWLEKAAEGMLPAGEWGAGGCWGVGGEERIEGEKSSCWALKAQTCDCCLYPEEQKGSNVVKGRRQSWLEYSVDSSPFGSLLWRPSVWCVRQRVCGETGMRWPFRTPGLPAMWNLNCYSTQSQLGPFFKRKMKVKYQGKGLAMMVPLSLES